MHGCLPLNSVPTALPIWLLHSCPLPQGRSITGELVFGYLAHQGHWDTAAAVARDVLGGTVAVAQQDVQDMQVGW